MLSRSDAVDADPIKNLERRNLGSGGKAVEKDFRARSCTVAVAVAVAVGYYHMDDDEDRSIIITITIFMK